MEAEQNAPQTKGPFAVQAPAISLPKGGGAIRSMGEKFSANPVTGSGSISVPIITSPGRSGFGPQLLLTYDSGAGNGIFGLGWSLGHPSILRKTDKGLPQYLDDKESDVFLISGVEDLVRLSDANNGKRLPGKSCVMNTKNYRVFLYRPRIEGSFHLIERWESESGVEAHFWRTISSGNITTWYGRSPQSRIADPLHPEHIFQWLPDESYDDKGNVILYAYARENSDNVENSIDQANRPASQHSANRYLKRIQYGNTVSRLDTVKWPSNEWMFEVVFDYGEHLGQNPAAPDSQQLWPLRKDAFSSYRACFEIRTNRLCHRILMFHHFSELNSAATLVSSVDLDYKIANNLNDPDQLGYAKLQSVSYLSFEGDDNASLQSHRRPPINFEYSLPKVSSELSHIDHQQLQNLPVGTDGQGYQWIDLNGEGLSGVLTEQGGSWFYKENLGGGTFGASRLVAKRPSVASLSSGAQQFMDLAGSGELALVDMNGPLRGFQKRTSEDSWQDFTPFFSFPNIDSRDPNLRFVDLTGDGQADAVISENEVFTWYLSLAEKGFDRGQRVKYALDEDLGPRQVFADGTQTIFLADVSGDGLSDLVRIRNGEICYWPNLGYCRFGAKVTFNNSPVFDHPELYDPRRIRLTDIDGSGTIDVIYLGSNGARLYFNRSGNSFSGPKKIDLPVTTENLGAVHVADLLGTGTACLVWNSHLPADTGWRVCYINLMAHGKPHLLKKIDNNLGGTTEIEYKPSTHFYLEDKLAGTPWITRLPFPVHCVSSVTACDRWRQTRFSNRYSYHHGYFDGAEREFRGFGRVEQVDVETYGETESSGPFITDEKELWQPPIKTVTWYHTGAAIDRKKILTQFANEYFPARYVSSFKEKPLLEPDLQSDINADEWREALRSCKGMVLRQEIYELDAKVLDKEKLDKPVRLYSSATHNCRIRKLQPRGENKHAVFQVTESEALTYYYELDLRSAQLLPDPRISHTLNLRHDEYGNPQQVATVTYGRVAAGNHPKLPGRTLIDHALIDKVQGQTHVAYAEIRYTNKVELPDLSAGQTQPVKHYRLPLPFETRTYEITGLPKSADFYFDIDDLRKYIFCEDLFYPSQVSVSERRNFTSLQYHELAQSNMPHRRKVEHACSRYFDDGDDTAGNPKTIVNPLPFGKLGPRGSKYEDYKLAITEQLLDKVFKQNDSQTGALIEDKLEWITESGETVREQFNKPESPRSNYLKSGYIRGQAIDPTFTGQYWMRSGIAGFAADAPLHFYLPEEYTDAFGNKTTLEYDDRYLFVRSVTDALGNTTRVENFDYRVLSPKAMVDANGNNSEAVFDIFGLPVASAVKGKFKNNKWEGDDLSGFNFDLRNPSPARIQAFCAATQMNEAEARLLLGGATARFIYHFGDQNGDWNKRMPGACGIQREKHVSQLQPGTVSPIRVSLECSDGFGNILMKKVQAEPASGQTGIRWIINGLTVLNNKGKPVRQFEPSFSEQGFGCELPPKKGVSTTIYYDAAGRAIRTEMPTGTFSRVEFSPWHVKTFDANDTVLESAWYDKRKPASSAADEEKNAAALAARHANTPSITILDSLGRDVISIAHNKVSGAGGQIKDEYYTTYSRLDAEGKPLWIRDALGHLVMQYIYPPKANDDPDENVPLGSVPCYDIAGNLLFQHSMDAGALWMITDAVGKPMYGWDINEVPDNTNLLTEKRLYSTSYDALHRPMANKLKINNSPAVMVERFEYQDAMTQPDNNLNGQLVRHYDPSGLVETIALDFKGSPLEVRRSLLKDSKSTLTDWQTTPDTKLETEAFTQITEYDAMKRMMRLFNWHRGSGSRVSVYVPEYGERGILKKETLTAGATKTANSYTGGETTVPVEDVRYDAKGQRQYLKLGNGTVTTYEYDPETYRLTNLRTRRNRSETCLPGTTPAFTNANIIQSLNYWYDPVGNITEINDAAFKTVYYNNQEIKPVNKYEYDALYRLVFAAGRENAAASEMPALREPESFEYRFPCLPDNVFRNYAEAYLYDAVGNIRQMRHEAGATGSWTRNYAYDFESPNRPASNRLWQTWNGTNRTNAITYDYDTHGSMLNLDRVPEEFRLRWDHRDMIASINLGGGGTAHYQYDSGKQRTRKTIVRGDNSVEERIYLGGLEIYRRKGFDGRIKEEIETLHLFDGESRLLMVDQVISTDNPKLTVGNLYRYTYSNHLGSASMELTEMGEFISYEEYHPYGTSAYSCGRNTAEVNLKRYRYTGMERDDESGLSYHHTRYYLVFLARFLSTDSIGVKGGTNLYSYCAANPIRRVDPKGTAPQTPQGYGNTFNTEVLKKYIEEGYGVFQEWSIGAKSRADAFLVNVVKKGKTTTEFLENKAMEGSRYLDGGTLKEGKIADKFRRYLKQASRYGSQSGVPVNLNIEVRGLSKAQYEQFVRILDEQIDVMHLKALSGKIKSYGKDVSDGFSNLKSVNISSKTLGGFNLDKVRDLMKNPWGAKLSGLAERAVQSKTLTKLAGAAKHLPGTKALKALMVTAVVAGTASQAHAATNAAIAGDYQTAIEKGGSASLDVIEMTPTPLGAVVGAGRTGYGLGEAAGEGLGIEDRAQKKADETQKTMLWMGASQDVSRNVAAVGASLEAINDFTQLVINPGALNNRISEEFTSWLRK